MGNSADMWWQIRKCLLFIDSFTRILTHTTPCGLEHQLKELYFSLCLNTASLTSKTSIYCPYGECRPNSHFIGHSETCADLYAYVSEWKSSPAAFWLNAICFIVKISPFGTQIILTLITFTSFYLLSFFLSFICLFKWSCNIYMLILKFHFLALSPLFILSHHSVLYIYILFDLMHPTVLLPKATVIYKYI